MKKFLDNILLTLEALNEAYENLEMDEEVYKLYRGRLLSMM